MHTGMLPKVSRFNAYFLGDEKWRVSIGVTVFMMDEGIDSGPILVQKLVSVGKKSQSELIRETRKLAWTLLLSL